MHGYLLMDGEKMSKSLGNVLDPFAVIERFGADALRFYLLRDVTFGQDGSVSTAAFEQRYETELANELGNLASRTIAMVARYRDGRRARRASSTAALARGLRRACASEVRELIDRAELTQALEEIWQRVRRLNRYVEERAPWQLAKDEARAGELDRVLRFAGRGPARGDACCCSPTCRRAPSALLDALGAPRRSRWPARSSAAGECARVSAIELAVPQGPDGRRA